MPVNLQRLPREPADLFTQPFARFLRIEAASATVLLLCVVVALALSNSPWSAPYLAFWETRIGIRWDTADLTHTIKDWLNDGAMTLFFFVVALELKRETVLGELRDPRTTAFAMAAALGGMLVPALLFVLLDGSATARGWGITMATDTQDRRDLHRAGIATKEAISPLERIELALHPWVAFVVLPLFALANAGFPLSQDDIDWRLTIAIVVGLSLGKPLGIVLFSHLATRLHLGVRPEGLSWPLIAGGATLTGIGFTMAILIAELALSPDRLGSAKLGILSASLLSAISGVCLLLWLTSARRGSEDDA